MESVAGGGERQRGRGRVLSCRGETARERESVESQGRRRIQGRGMERRRESDKEERVRRERVE